MQEAPKLMIPILLLTSKKKNIVSYIKTIRQENDHIIFLEPEKREYTIEQIKTIIQDIIIVQPYRRIYVLENFHESSHEAQNAFLKTLEESPQNIIFVITGYSTNAFLSTILSRVKIVSLEKGDATKTILSEETMQTFELLFSKKDMSILSEKLFIAPNQQSAIDLILQLLIFFQKRIGSPFSCKILKELLYKKKLLENNNLNPQLTIDNLLIYIQKQYTMNTR